MALPSTIQDRDFGNFSDNGDGTYSRFVKVVSGGGSGGGSGLLGGIIYDYVSATYPDSVTEIYAFKRDRKSVV